MNADLIFYIADDLIRLYSAIFKHALILTAVRSGTYIIVYNFDFLTLIQFNSVIMKEYLAYINLFLIYLF